MTHVGIKEIFLPFLWKFTQHLASSGKTRFLHIRRTGTEGEEGEVQMGAGRGKKEPVTKGLSRAESPARGQHKAKWAGAEEKSCVWGSLGPLQHISLHTLELNLILELDQIWDSLTAHPLCPSDHLCQLLHRLQWKTFYGSARVILVQESTTFCNSHLLENKTNYSRYSHLC